VAGGEALVVAVVLEFELSVEEQPAIVKPPTNSKAQDRNLDFIVPSNI
jgi:hypothetical protein